METRNEDEMVAVSDTGRKMRLDIWRLAAGNEAAESLLRYGNGLYDVRNEVSAWHIEPAQN